MQPIVTPTDRFRSRARESGHVIGLNLFQQRLPSVRHPLPDRLVALKCEFHERQHPLRERLELGQVDRHRIPAIECRLQDVGGGQQSMGEGQHLGLLQSLRDCGLAGIRAVGAGAYRVVGTQDGLGDGRRDLCGREMAEVVAVAVHVADDVPERNGVPAFLQGDSGVHADRQELSHEGWREALSGEYIGEAMDDHGHERLEDVAFTLEAGVVDDAPIAVLVDEGAGAAHDVLHPEHEAQHWIVAGSGKPVDPGRQSILRADQVVGNLGVFLRNGGQLGDPLLEGVALDVVGARHRGQFLRLFLHPLGERASALGFSFEVFPGRGDEEVVQERADEERQGNGAVVPTVPRGGAQIGRTGAA